jgi:hypothetical protein
MKNAHELMEEVIEFTSEIETEYPELYKYLEETPLFQGPVSGSDVSAVDLENYLNTLKRQVIDYLKTHDQPA